VCVCSIVYIYVYVYTYTYLYIHIYMYIHPSSLASFKATRSVVYELKSSKEKKPTRVAAPSPRASLGRRTVCGRTEQRRPPGSKRCEIKVRMVWGSFLIAAEAHNTHEKW